MCSEPGFGASVSSSLTTTGAGSPSSWEDVRRELSNDQVKSIHEMLWPKDTNIADLLPRPDRRVFRAVYMGFIDLRTIVMSVISTLAYFDEIVILNPFPNPVYINPTQSPAQHKSQTLKNVSVLLTLQPFIDAGIVHFVPDPMEFNADFRRAMMVMIEKRRAQLEAEARRDATRGDLGWCRLELSGLGKRWSSFWRKSSNRKASGYSGGFELRAFLEFMNAYAQETVTHASTIGPTPCPDRPVLRSRHTNWLPSRFPEGR